MNREWRNGAVRLVEGYTLRDASGAESQALNDVQFSIEGGFVHVKVPGVVRVQVVSAPAVRVLDYRE